MNLDLFTNKYYNTTFIIFLYLNGIIGDEKKIILQTVVPKRSKVQQLEYFIL